MGGLDRAECSLGEKELKGDCGKIVLIGYRETGLAVTSACVE